jgi:putative oxidoreductase
MTSSRSLDAGLMALRLALGVVFVAHGAQKLFSIGYGPLTAMLGGLGMPLPGVNAAVLIAVELAGGLALIAGAMTRVTASLLAFTMAVATFTVHFANGFFMSNNGFEFTFTLGLASVALALTGAGAWSVDARLSRPQPASRGERRPLAA